MFKTIMLLSTIAALAPAQTTWKGLRFGMSEAEVRKEYKGTLRTVQANEQRILIDDEVELLESTKLRARVSMEMGTSGKLGYIGILVEEPFAKISRKDGITMSLRSVIDLNTKLSEKYGHPLTEECPCQSLSEIAKKIAYEPRSPISCNKMWKSDGQTIELYWAITDGRLRLWTLAYKPVPTDL